MSSSIFSHATKVAVIQSLIERRMSRSGYDELTISKELTQLSEPQLMSTPEAMLVTVIETTLVLQQRGLLIGQIVESIERHRSQLGTNENQMNMIRAVASGPLDRAHTAIPYYCLYRMKIEFPGVIADNDMLTVYNDAERAVINASQ